MAGKAQEKPLIPNTKGSSKGDGDPTQSPHSSRSSTSSWSEEPVSSNLDISTGHMVLAYMEDHLKNKDRLEQEWLALCAYEAEPSTTNIAHLPENEKKNRRAEAVPYDHSRVVLNDLTNISGSDYINASSITDHDPRNPAYIATQGPLPVTAADFWQMVWEQGSVVIVMLTRLTENALPLCHRYWPEEGSEVYHIYEVILGSWRVSPLFVLSDRPTPFPAFDGTPATPRDCSDIYRKTEALPFDELVEPIENHEDRVEVHLVSEHIWCEDYLVRSFYLKNLKTGETRTVTQFHFLSWPQDGVPSSARALLEFRRKVNKSYRGRSCPIVIHCRGKKLTNQLPGVSGRLTRNYFAPSDGAGRTGTYCLIDMVLNRMGKGAKEIDIAATLEHIRDQRPGMVATRAQFEFVLVAVAEEVHAILKALPQ
ncbi:unnamed protein product [Darwinula stevensoni]|uniref:Uncharacterized protein n=1 Tax=Darwinula stevensoni TaxID=69355 RepID=A0A7R9FPS9_9CRUS|nr:unnamed protein product [Darwinula stevensoni]CAG0898059.1 unnamed protein product [Darwinula stevensoni]